MWYKGILYLLSLAVPLVVTAPGSVAGPDPVTTFIAQADSAALLSDSILEQCVAENLPVVGAAVGHLIDTAVQVADDSSVTVQQEQLDFAEQLATLYQDQTGSKALLDLVAIYRGWDKKQLETRRQAKALEQQAITARQLGDYPKAIELFNQARTLLESIGDDHSVAVLWGSLGVAWWYTGNYDEVKRQYDHALAARRAIEDRILEGRTLNGLGSVNFQQGRYGEAFDFYSQAIELRRTTGDIAGLGTSLTYLGNTYLALGRIIDARTSYEEALPLVEQSGDRTKLYEILTSVASLHAECGRMASSNDALERALKIAQSLNDPIKQLVCRNNLALNLADTYRYSEALEQLDAARALVEQTSDPEQTIIFHRNNGITLMKLGELKKARDELLTLLRSSREHKMSQFELEALINLGYLLKELTAYEQGLAYATDARTLAEQLDNPNMAREAAVLSAEFERLLGHADSALEQWQLLLDHDEKAGNDTDCMTDKMAVANLLAVTGHQAEARRLFHTVRRAVEEAGRGDLKLVVELGLGHSFERSNPDSAGIYYEQALSLLGGTREQLDDRTQTGFMGGSRRYYYEEIARFYAQQSLADNNPDWSGRAFRTIERAKARGLLDMMTQSLCARTSPAEEALLDSLFLAASSDENTKTRYKKRYDEERARRIESELAQFRAAQTIAAPGDISRFLPDHSAFLSYALGDTLSLLWVIDGKGCGLYELPDRASLRAAVEQLRDAISHPGIGDDVARRSAYELFDAIVAPAAKRLEDVQELIVSPDGVLFELPFELLLTSPADDGDGWQQLPYLARSFSVSYIPSASVYFAMHDGGKKISYDKELLAFGDPDYSLLPASSDNQNKWQRLPYSREEVQAIAASLSGPQQETVYLGADATEQSLKLSLRDCSYRVVHLATHGSVDPADPALSCIVLCPDRDGSEDGYLHTMELLSMHPAVGLAVLSACESARGTIGRGEGVVGLSRALLAAGAKGVVASLWSVSDESTALLMDAFYEQMFKEKQPACRALNEARLALMNDERFAHPYYWSPFIVIGDERTPW